MAQVSTMAGQAADDPISQQACGEDDGAPQPEAEKKVQLVTLQPPERSLPKQVTGDPALLG